MIYLYERQRPIGLERANRRRILIRRGFVSVASRDHLPPRFGLDSRRHRLATRCRQTCRSAPSADLHQKVEEARSLSSQEERFDRLVDEQINVIRQTGAARSWATSAWQEACQSRIGDKTGETLMTWVRESPSSTAAAATCASVRRGVFGSFL